MCGIFGAIRDNCVSTVLNALKRLEYRGYDSAGIAYKQDGIRVDKCVGRVDNLQKIVFCNADTVAVGHTRWATHGNVSDKNAHPFLSQDGNFAIVHNGIIENYVELRRFLVNRGYTFTSDTDSEVIAHLLQYEYKGNVTKAIIATAQRIVGSYAVAVVSNYNDNLYAFKCNSPLVVGTGDNCGYVCSDVNTLSHYVTSVAVLPNNTVACVTRSGINAVDYNNKRVPLQFIEAVQDKSVANTGEDVMLKEITEIPEKLALCKRNYIKTGLSIPKKVIKKADRIYLVGCGTAYHSGLSCASVFRKLTEVDVIPVIASEFNCDCYPVTDKTLAIFITQSGETADTVKAVSMLVKRGGYAHAVTNTAHSSVCFVANSVSYVCAGEEIAVASTKAYNCQLLTLILIALDIACVRGEVSKSYVSSVHHSMDKLPQAVNSVLSRSDEVRQVAEQIKDCSAVFYIGRKGDYPTAMEGSLKLKEISYIHSEAYPAGELKHGTLALIEPGVCVVAIATDMDVVAKINTAVSEVSSRGAKVVIISPYGGRNDAIRVIVPVVNSLLTGIISVVPLQLLSFYVAKMLDRDVDKPRNLAKSVTVE